MKLVSYVTIRRAAFAGSPHRSRRLSGLALVLLVWHTDSASAVDVRTQTNASVQISAKSDWRDRDPNETVLRRSPMGRVRFLSIHHTQTPVPDLTDERERLRNIQSYHQEEKGWGDIAYHFLIGPSGTVYQGRALAYSAASNTKYLTKTQWESAPQDGLGHTNAKPPAETAKPGATEGHITVCFIGDFGLKLPTDRARISAIRLLKQLMRTHDLGTEAILTHREIAQTDCPGQALHDWFRGAARDRSGRGAAFEWLSRKSL